MWPDPRVRDDVTLRHAGTMGIALRRTRHPALPIDASLSGWLARVVLPRLVWALVLVLLIIPVMIAVWWNQMDVHWVIIPEMSG